MTADTYLSPAIPLGFSFVFDGATFTEVKASSNGWLSFNTAGTSNPAATLAGVSAATRPMVAPLLDDLDGNPTGATATGSYSTTGTAPNRVFTFEWINWEWRWNSNAAGLSFQVKLYEGSNRVEFIYRQESGAINATASSGASIGLAGTGTGAGSYLSLSDATAAPTASSTTENTNIFTKPATGQVYAFTPPAATGCPQPRNLSVSALTNTTAAVTWTATGSGTYSIQYGVKGFTPGSSAATTVTSTTTSVTLTGLTANTAYDFYVTQVCGGSAGTSLVSPVGSFTTRAVGPPTNDECAGAVTLTPAADATCAAATNGTVEGATGPGTLVAPVGTADDDVWYKFTATAAVHTVTLTGTGDYVQQLLSGSCGSLTPVDYSDPSVKTYTGLTVGTVYYVRVYSYGATFPTAAAAAFTICVTSSPAPNNDACANAVTLTPATTGAACTAATNGTIEGATGTTGLAAPTGTADDDVWYKFTATSTVHTVTLTGTGNYVQELLTGSCGSLTSFDFSDPNVKTYTGLSVGTVYYVRVYSFGTTQLASAAAAFTICVTTSTPPANDACANAVTLTPAALDAACTAATSGTIEGASGTAGLATPVGAADDDVWYKFTATAAVHTVTLTGTGDYVQELLSGNCGSLTSVGFSDPNAKTYTGLSVGTVYYVRVYSYASTTLSTAASAFTICVTTPTPITPPANDECAAAITLTPSANFTCTAATNGTLVGATGPGTLVAPVGTADDDVWYKFIATATSHTVTLTGSGDYVQQLLSGSCGSLTSVGFSDPSVRLYTGLTIGNTYYVRVFSYSATVPSATAAAFTICITTPPVNDEPCGAITVPVVAGCASPTQGTNDGATTTTPSGYTNPGCGIAASPLDVWYKFTTAATGASSTAVSVTTTGVAAGQVRVFSAASCTGPFTQVGCKFSSTATAGTLDLTALTPSTTYYVFVSGYSSTTATGAFTLCVTPPPTCAAPTGLAASAVTLTSATLSWTSPAGSGPFTVEYGPRGFTPGSTQGTVVTATTTSVNLTNLASGTTYQFYVTQNCGGTSGSSLPSGPVAFTTLAAPPANDECATATEVTVQFGSTCSNRIVATNAGATASSNIPAPGCSSYTGGDVWFKVVVPSTGSLIATTDSVAGSDLKDTGMAIYSGTCGALTVVNCNDDGGDGLFSQLELTGRTPGEVLYIRVFEYGNDVFGRFKLCVRSNSACPAPIGLNASNIATTSARLNWAVTSTVAGATFNVEYGPQGFTPGSSAGTRLTGLTGTFVDITGLTANTEYCYYVSQNCGNTGATAGTSPATGPVCFSTPAPIPANNDACGAVNLPISSAACTPVNGNNTGATTSVANGYVNPGCTTSNSPKDVWFTMTTSAAAGSVQITTTGGPAGQVRIFTAAACSTAFTQVACRASSGNNQTVGSFDVTLAPSTQYYVMVAGYGSNDATGAFTICARQTVLSNAKELPGGEVSVFPNPSSTGTVTLRIRGAEQTKAVQATLLNALGQQVLTQSVAVQAGAVEAPLSVKGLATGIYTLRVKVGDYTITRKVVLE
ncbi:fibronectin type III domain-containing protein [Hymenobacter cellulosivorans]|uniref:Fibronectin type III domain-containing protein n=1 Tax=Hymenobacter cellulosivorans TaxID=2932249 RepID=A0ABY4FBH9_9BACT|nr:fibronectin type III domain-containing protein [Hymenobacter cellulosivorans]UOQ53442.1 fibronectin type III domain-containing protein [Hymenobacter cellulosivorans]